MTAQPNPAALRIDRALAGNAEIDALIAALVELKTDRINCARQHDYYHEWMTEQKVARLYGAAFGCDEPANGEVAREELHREGYDPDGNKVDWQGNIVSDDAGVRGFPDGSWTWEDRA